MHIIMLRQMGRERGRKERRRKGLEKRIREIILFVLFGTICWD